MFEFVRSHTRLFQFILVVLIFPSFVFFGVQGYTRFADGSMRDVAQVDGRGITQAEWDAAHQRAVEQMRRQMPGIDPKLLDSPQARQETLQNLVRERVMLAAANSAHLFPGDERLARLFRSDPQFAGLRNPDGTVNKELLSAQGMSSEGFAEQLRTDLGVRQVMAGLGAATMLPKATATQTLESWLQRREIEFERFAAAEYAARVKPADADLEAWYKANEAVLRLPEQAQIEYVVLGLDALKKNLEIPEADLQKYYDDNAARYTSPEERRASHILLNAPKDMAAAERQKVRDKAQALLEQVRKAPATFAEVARKNSQDPGSAERGGDLEFFGRGAMVKPFEDKAFSMKAGEISDLVETDFGFHIIQLTAVRGGARRPFAEVRAEIDGVLRTQQAQRRFAESAEQFTNTVYEQSDSLQPAVDKFKLEKRTATVQRTAPPGAQGPLASARLLEAVFAPEALKNKRNTEAVDVGGSQLVSARVVSHEPARVPPLAEVRERVRDAVIREQASALAKKDGLARLAEVQKDASRSLPRKLVIARNVAQDAPRALLEAVLRVAPDKLPASVGVDLGADGYVVVRVLKVLPREVDAQTEQALTGQLTQLWGAAESAAYVEALKKRFKADVKPAAKAGAASAPTAGS
ncbi:MAG: SurA N-terminal domain-containing protein [Rubrivivax sp.]